jgi:hypothetical protein
LDLLRCGSPDIQELISSFQEVCDVRTGIQDGIEFLSDTVWGEAIREENEYDGVSVKLEHRTGRIGQFMQIDIGFGNTIVPPANRIQFPTILEMALANLEAYPLETVMGNLGRKMLIRLLCGRE